MKKMISISVLLLASSFLFSFSEKISSGQKEAKVGLEIGDKAPEINLSNPDGKLIAMSSLKGKMVLLDFWASWCGPCRGELPNLVSLYNKYKSSAFKNAKGFEIYSVSLDQNKEAWTGAISKFGLTWTHVSDLKWWNADAAKTYNIQFIPQNLLLDANGIILAKNLHGTELENELAKYVK